MSTAWLSLRRLDGVLAEMPDPSTWSDGAERQRAAALVRPEQRLRFWAGRWQLRALLQAARGAQAALTVDAQGRARDPEGWALSLSHSGDWLAAAASDGEALGVDVEAPKPTRNWQRLARHCDFEPCSAPADFYRQWTLVEAWYKAQPDPQQPYGWKRWRWAAAEAGRGGCWAGEGLHLALYGPATPPMWLDRPNLSDGGRWEAISKTAPLVPPLTPR